MLLSGQYAMDTIDKEIEELIKDYDMHEKHVGNSYRERRRELIRFCRLENVYKI